MNNKQKRIDYIGTESYAKYLEMCGKSFGPSYHKAVRQLLLWAKYPERHKSLRAWVEKGAVKP